MAWDDELGGPGSRPIDERRWRYAPEQTRGAAGGRHYDAPGRGAWGQRPEWRRDDYEDEEAWVRPSVRHSPDLYPSFGPDSPRRAHHEGWAPTEGRRSVSNERPPAPRGPYAGRGPKGYQRSNERIREDVADRLYEDAWLDATDIDIAVENGIVTLTGTVTDRGQKRRAEDLAEQVTGVNDVHNQLRIEGRAGESGESGEWRYREPASWGV